MIVFDELMKYDLMDPMKIQLYENSYLSCLQRPNFDIALFQLFKKISHVKEQTRMCMHAV